jgi:hypothetical protein
MSVCRNPIVNCAIVERFNRTLKSKHKWITRNNRCVDVLDRLVSGQNSAVHSSTGMAPPLVTDKDVAHMEK